MDTRKRIVDTASRLFYHQGYNSTGINQIIEEADVAKTSLYQHFRSKEDLLIEYLEIAFQQTMDGLRSAAAAESGRKEKIVAIFGFLPVFIQSTGFYGCNFLNIAAEVPKDNERVNAVILKQKNGIRALFAGILGEGGKDLADELYLLFDAALMSCRVYGDVWPALASKRIAEKLL
jgi:AcrR family transcriptional regulator